MKETEKYFMFKIVYFVEWIENGELRKEWFSIEKLAYDYARKVGGVVIEKDVS
jgi:hypothetical protein